MGQVILFLGTVCFSLSLFSSISGRSFVGNVDPFDNYFSSGSGYVEIIRSARFIRFKQLQYCHRDLLIESAGTAAPGIKIHSIPFPGAGVAVAVSIDDEIGVVILRDISF